MTRRYLVYIICGVAILAGLYIYRPTDLFFLADDFLHIPESAEHLLTQRNSLRPIGNISLFIDGNWSEKSPFGYHLTNLFLHCINSVLVFFLARQFVKRFARLSSTSLIPLLSSIFFFVYAFHSETIFWIIGRSASLGGLFFILAMIFYLRADKTFFNSVATLIFFELGLLSYESSWVFPLIVSLSFFFEKKKGLLRNYKLIVAIWVLFVLHLRLRFMITGQVLHQYDTNSFINADIVELGMNYLRLIARSFLPPFIDQQNMIIAFAVVMLLFASAVFFLIKQKRIGISFYLLIAAWLISYLPYLSLGIDTHGTEGERYLYLPSVFFVILIVYVLSNIINEKWLVGFFVIMVTINIYYLVQSRSYYVKAATVVETAITEIEKLKEKQNVYFENLPQYNKGAVVFRLGLEEGVKWLAPQIKSNLIVFSIDSSDIKVKDNHLEKFTSKEIETSSTFAVKRVLIKDLSFKKTYAPKDTAGLYFHPHTDAWLRFTDTSLIIIK